jgi:hypothetical protein
MDKMAKSGKQGKGISFPLGKEPWYIEYSTGQVPGSWEVTLRDGHGSGLDCALLFLRAVVFWADGWE